MTSKSSVLRTKTKCEMLRLRHYQFRQRIIDRLGSKVKLCTEEYTSKTCTKCGSLNHKLGGSEVYKCIRNQCKYEINRDINGARNILIKNLVQ